MAKKETGKSLVNWDAEFANYQKESKKGIQLGAQGKFLSFKNGLSFQGVELEDDEVRCVIIGWTHHNQFYDQDVPYDPDNPQTPICYSFGQDQDTMEPSNHSPDKQHGDCASCPFNQFESARTGKGKACKNTFRIALIAESDLDNIDQAEVIYASIPPKSLKNFAKYIGKDLDKYSRPHWAVVTLLKRVADSKAQFVVTFDCVEVIKDSKLFQPLKDLYHNTMEGIDFPYEVREAAAKPAKKAPNKFSKGRK